MQRAADAVGYLFWLNEVRTKGRSATRDAFAESTEFRALLGGLCRTAELTGERHWVLTDQAGSVRVVLDEAGEVVGRRDNLPFGQPILDVGSVEARGAMEGTETLSKSSLSYEKYMPG